MDVEVYNEVVERYEYMNFLFERQPADKWIFRSVENIDEALNELFILGQWFPSIDLPPFRRFTENVIQNDMYNIIIWRTEYMREHHEEYARYGGQVPNPKHGGMLDPYYSLRKYCLVKFPETNDDKIDSIYFVNVYPE